MRGYTTKGAHGYDHFTRLLGAHGPRDAALAHAVLLLLGTLGQNAQVRPGSREAGGQGAPLHRSAVVA